MSLSHFLRAVGLGRLGAALTGGHFSAAAHVNCCAARVMYSKLCCAVETTVQRSGLDLPCRGEKKKSCLSLIHISRVAVTVSSAEAEASPRLCLLRAPPRAGLADFSAALASSVRLRAGCPPWEQAACGYARVRTLAQKAEFLKKELCQQIISSYFGYHNPLQASTKHSYVFDQVTIKEKYCAILASWTTYTLVSL